MYRSYSCITVVLNITVVYISQVISKSAYDLTFLFYQFFTVLASISFDPKQDWGVRIGNWYIIRKVTGNDDDSSDSDSDEWDMRSLIPNLPSFPILGIDWTPNIHEFEIPKTTQLPMTTPKIELTMPQQTPQTNIQTESVLTESTVILTEPIPFTTQLTATSTEPVATSTEEILTSTESSVTNDESDTVSTESILTSTETIPVSIESTVPSTESAVTSTELITSSIETTLDSTESIVTSIESVVTVTESIETLTEEIATSTITELPDRTSTEVILPVFNKRIEDNETVNTRTTKKPRPASAEVIMF